MRILTKPRVYLIGRPQVNEEGLEAFLKENGLAWPTPTEGVKGAERLVESAGRDCYMSYGKKAGSKTNQEYINNLIGIGREGPAHGSVCEHVYWVFKIVGAGRGFSHEQVRHRVGVGYSQLSTRYCDFERSEAEDGTWEPGFCIPPLAQLDGHTKDIYEEAYVAALENYKRLLRRITDDLESNKDFQSSLSNLPERDRIRALRKAARGAARDILPIGTEAIMTVSANARAIWNMAHLRASEHAEGVIRDVYVQIVKIMEEEMPSLFNNIVYEKVWDGSICASMPKDKL